MAKKHSAKKKGKNPKKSVQKVTYTVMCAQCGSTRINKINLIDTCADCSSTHTLTVPSSTIEEVQNRILEHEVEKKFQVYMDRKHHQMANRKFLWIFIGILVLIGIIFLVLLYAVPK
jgi:tRNA G26 N,N-dimethylase Trm1